MAKDLTQQLSKGIVDCKCFSLQLDESTDMSDTAHDFLNYHCIIRQQLELGLEIKKYFCIAKHAEYKQLNDDQWLLDLAFLCDLTNMLDL